jgi:tRNA threonylcarbamoyladenosine biosynthesis protein TsaE
VSALDYCQREVAIRSLSTASAAETEALGAQIAGLLGPGSVVLVRGELGAGKTTLVRGAARALGVTAPVTSPTFTIANRYRGGALAVAHLDLYRLADLALEDPELLDDYLGEGQVVFIEWPERGAQELVQADLRVTLSHGGGDRRAVAIEDAGADAHASGARRA